MPSLPQPWSRRVGRVLCLALLGLIAVGVLIRPHSPNDLRYLFVRWPVWLVGGVGIPLLALRIALWRHGRRAGPAAPGRPPAS